MFGSPWCNSTFVPSVLVKSARELSSALDSKADAEDVERQERNLMDWLPSGWNGLTAIKGSCLPGGSGPSSRPWDRLFFSVNEFWMTSIFVSMSTPTVCCVIGTGTVDAYTGVCVSGAQSRLTLVNPWTVAHQAPLSMGWYLKKNIGSF